MVDGIQRRAKGQQWDEGITKGATSGQGRGEQEDAEAAISCIRTIKEFDSERIGLAEYSAGSVFALPVDFKDARIKALAAISPPLSMFDFDFL